MTVNRLIGALLRPSAAALDVLKKKVDATFLCSVTEFVTPLYASFQIAR